MSDAKQPRQQKLVPWLSLIVIGGVCAGVLLVTENFTATSIQDNRTAQAKMVFQALLGTPLPGEWQPHSWTGHAAPQPQVESLGSCQSWLFSHHREPGYAGDIQFLALWSAAQAEPQLSLRVSSHHETPGIGDFIDHQRSPWITRLDGTTLASAQAIDVVSGATITSNAVKRAVQQIFTSMDNYCGRKHNAV